MNLVIEQSAHKDNGFFQSIFSFYAYVTANLIGMTPFGFTVTTYYFKVPPKGFFDSYEHLHENLTRDDLTITQISVNVDDMMKNGCQIR